MFQTVLNGKTGSVVVSYAPEEALYEAVVVKKNDDDKMETSRLKDTDPYLLYKQIRHTLANEAMSALVMKKFVRQVGAVLRVLSIQRRAFLTSSRPDFAKVRASLKKAHEARKAADKAAGKVRTKPGTKKSTKKSAKKPAAE